MTVDQDGLPALATKTATTEHQSAATGLVGDVKRGAMWTGASTLLLRFSNIALMAVVARIVAPDQLGVFGLAVTAHAVLVSIAELGVASAIARSDLDVDKIAPTVTSIAIFSSLVLGGLMASFAGPLAGLLGSPLAEDPIRILAISVALIGPFAVPGADLQRTFRQDLIFRANIVSFVPASAVLVIVASGGDGASAFAWSRVVGQLIAGLLMLLSVPKTYLPGFRRAYLWPLMRFGLPLAMANILSQALLNVDYIFVGRLMSTADVGKYLLAFNVCMWSTALVGSVINGVVLPAFSQVRRDEGDVPKALQSAVRTVALIVSPIAAVTCTFATPLITVIYGSQWTEAGPVLRVLSFYGVVFVLGLLFANIIIATGRTWVLFSVQLIALLCLMPALAVGIRVGGLVGIGAAHIVVISLVTLPAYLRALHKSTGVRASKVLLAPGRPFIAAAAAALVAWCVTLPVESDLAKLAIGGVCIAVVYVAVTLPLLVALMPGSWGRWLGASGLYRVRPTGRRIQSREKN